MRIIRPLGLVALLALVTVPVIRLDTAGPPSFLSFQIRENDLTKLTGSADPGACFSVHASQRTFREGETSFAWCNWLNNGGWLHLGDVCADANGKWTLSGLDFQVHPGGVADHDCTSGLLTRFHTCYAGSCYEPPELAALRLYENGGQEAISLHVLPGAKRVSWSVADGPNDQDTDDFPADTDEDGVEDVPGLFGGDHRILVNCSGANGAEFVCASVELRDGSTLIGPQDHEYSFALGQVQAHKPGASFLAVTKVPRGPVGPTVNVNVNVKAKLKLGCEAPSFFDFFDL